MIREDYVSFKTAKLLKEKGFDLECDYLYVDGEIRRAQGYACNWNSGETILTDYVNECSAPTLQTAMKWLKKVHNLHVEVHYNTFWDYYQYIILYRGEKIESDMAYHSFEDAAEAVIKFCLKKLI